MEFNLSVWGFAQGKIHGKEAFGISSTAHAMIKTSTPNFVVFDYGLKFLVSNYPAQLLVRDRLPVGFLFPMGPTKTKHKNACTQMLSAM